jgi:hypothetical protein
MAPQNPSSIPAAIAESGVAGKARA